MTIPQTVKLAPEGAVLLSGHPKISLWAACSDRGRLVDVRIHVGAKGPVTFPRFAASAPRTEDGGVFPASVDYYWKSGGNASFLILIGYLQVLLFDQAALEFHPLLQLNRKENEDSGYHHLYIHECGEFCMIRYESGVCKVSYDGQVKHHFPLKWDDVFIREEPDGLLYANEHKDNGSTWKISF